MKPAVSILNPAFGYVPAVATNLAKTFERVRAEAQAATQAKADREAKDRAQASTDTQRVVDIFNARAK